MFANSRNCGTCDKWGQGLGVMTANGQDENSWGRCTCPTSEFNIKTVRFDHSCSEWQAKTKPIATV